MRTIKTMSNQQNDLYFEEIQDAEQEVTDCMEAWLNDMRALNSAQKWVEQSGKNLIQAKLRLKALKRKDV